MLDLETLTFNEVQHIIEAPAQDFPIRKIAVPSQAMPEVHPENLVASFEAEVEE